MKNKIFFPALIFILIFTVLYLIFAFRPLGKEYQFEPEWNINISTPTISEIPKQTNVYSFKSGNKLGYFTEDGKISHFVSFNDKAAICEDFYTIFKQNAVSAPIFDKSGNEICKTKVPGFPYFSGNNIFVILPGGASFSKCDTEGNEIWRYKGIIPITAFSSKKDFTACGFANGIIKVFDNKDGTTILEYAPGGSDYPVILGLDISDNGEYIASVSGQESQRFVLARKENTQVKILYHDFISDSLPYQTIVHFTDDNNSVLYNYRGGIVFYNISEKKSSKAKLSEQLISVKECDDVICMLGEKKLENDTKKKQFAIYIFEKNYSYVGEFSFAADYSFIRTNENSLFIGRDQEISKINIIKK